MTASMEEWINSHQREYDTGRGSLAYGVPPAFL